MKIKKASIDLTLTESMDILDKANKGEDPEVLMREYVLEKVGVPEGTPCEIYITEDIRPNSRKIDVEWLVTDDDEPIGL